MYCAKCGAAIALPAPAPKSGRAFAATAAVRRPNRRFGRRLLAGLVLLGVAGAIYWGYREHGFERIAATLRPAYSPGSPYPDTPLPQYSLPDSRSQIGVDAGAAFDRVWVEGDTIDADGYTGLRVHALIHAAAGSPLIFSAHFHYSDGSLVRTNDERYRDPDYCTATSASFSPSGGGDEVTAFLPRGEMLLEPGEHAVQVLPALLDSQGRGIATAPAVGITARRDASYITRVRCGRVMGSAGGTLSLKVSFVLDRALKGPMGEVVALFRDSHGVDLVGHAPYANSTNGLMAYTDFRSRSPWGNEKFNDVVVTIPDGLVPDGATALVFVEDASTRRAVTEAVRCGVR